MQFKDGDGRVFELSLRGYQFPGPTHTASDAHWLVISVCATDPRGSWSANAACLTTWEVASLATWLRHVAKGEQHDLSAEFVEPCLAFHHVNTTGHDITLEIDFALELRPPWTDFEDGYSLTLTVPRSQMTAGAASLRAESGRLPPLGEHPRVVACCLPSPPPG